MIKKDNNIKANADRILLYFCLMVGVFFRVIYFGDVPAGINQDEAYAGYEAYSILNEGMDSWGYHFPVYLTAWGSGMNALESYLMIPWIAVFGLKVWAIRMPQLLISIASLFSFYFLVEKMTGNKWQAVSALFCLSISPWHIMMSRWGLESNLAPGFLLFGLTFFVVGLEKRNYLILSALFYGMSLYTYAAIWPIMPIILGGQLVYAWIIKKIRVDRITIFSGIVFLVLAVPLIMFLLVNYGVIPEVRKNWISIPRMVVFRGGELTEGSFLNRAKRFIKIMLKQDDGLITNVIPGVGMYYSGSWFLWGIGIFEYVRGCIKQKEFKQKFDTLLIPQMIAGIILGLTVYSNINRVNILHIPNIYFASKGLYFVGKSTSRFLHKGVLLYGILGLALSIWFGSIYFGEYREKIGVAGNAGLDEAMEYAESLSNNCAVYISEDFLYSKVLFYSRIPAEQFIDSVQWRNFPDAYLRTASFGTYIFGVDSVHPGCICVILDNDIERFRLQGFHIMQFQNCAVAY